MALQDLRVERLKLVQFDNINDIKAADEGEVNIGMVGGNLVMVDEDGVTSSSRSNGEVAFPATTGAVELDLSLGNTFTVVPTGDITLTVDTDTLANTAGQIFFLKITTSGTTSRTITFSTGFSTKVSTFATGKTSAAVFLLAFYSNGSSLKELIWDNPKGVVALTAGASVAIDPRQGDVFTLTPDQATSITITPVIAGQSRITLIITTSGTSSFTLTFSTGFAVTAGTLATGTSTAKTFVVTFTNNGTGYVEAGRTAAM
jgi:hypothetical protein